MVATYPYAHGCGPDPKKKPFDKYWKYKNDDPSTAYCGTIVANEIFPEIFEIIKKRGKDIYGVRHEAIIVQDLLHEVIRKLAYALNERVKRIEKIEQCNSGDIRNYFDSDSEKKDREK